MPSISNSEAWVPVSESVLVPNSSSVMTMSATLMRVAVDVLSERPGRAVENATAVGDSLIPLPPSTATF